MTAKQRARGLVVALIEWEMNAADGESMAAACERYGRDRICAELEKIRDRLIDAGVERATEDELRNMGF